jgi:carbamoyltransferase
MNILGVGFLSESSACIVKDGELIAAVSEERLNRIKNWYGYPEAAIQEVLSIANLRIDEIDHVATHGLSYKYPNLKAFDSKCKLVLASDLDDETKRKRVEFLWQRYDHELKVCGERTPNYIQQIRNLGRPLKVYGHHHAHAASAFYGSGWDECLALTIDGWGEDGSHSLYRCSNGAMEKIAGSATIDSLGYFYGSITKALGFTPHRHEGKVLGLAAHGGPVGGRLCDLIRSMVGFDPDKGSFTGHIERGLYLPHFDNLELTRLVREYPREQVAAAAQMALEDVVCDYIASLGRKHKLAVAGGIFANVVLNQAISHLPNVEDLYVFPNMGDGGLSVGAAWLAHHELTGRSPKAPRDMYLGSDIGSDKTGEILQQSGLSFKHTGNIHNECGRLLADGYPVIRCAGRMEFGPRSLGNRSILYQATDPSVNDWLNKRLGRSEFMPFAPATIFESAWRCYLDFKGGLSGQHMTRTYSCTPKMRTEAPAAVHVDNTARPQVVSPDHAPDLHAILKSYNAGTNLSSVINTSFNMHEEPIVNNAIDALRAFNQSGLPYLAIGDFLVEQSGGQLASLAA